MSETHVCTLYKVIILMGILAQQSHFLILVVSQWSVDMFITLSTLNSRKHCHVIQVMSKETLPCIELPRVGLFFLYRCLVFPKNVLKENLNISELLDQVKRPKNLFFHHIHSNPILINLTP